MPRRVATIVDAAGVRRVRTHVCGGIVREVTFGEGVECVPCGVGCGCSAPCIARPNSAVTGVFIGRPNIGDPGVAYTSGPSPVTCCCGPEALQRFEYLFRREVRCRSGPCAGARRQHTEELITWDGATNRRTRRRVNRFYGVSCCGPEQVTVEEDEAFPPPGSHCGGDSLWTPNHGWAVTNPATPPGITIASGSFAFTCNAAVYTHRYSDVLGVLAPPADYEEHQSSAVYPASEACLPGHCERACCLPEGRCLEVPPSVCLGLGGVISPHRYCIDARCGLPGPGKGACCQRATGNCLITAPLECVSPNVFLGGGTSCSGSRGGPCPPPQGRCCIPDGLGGFTCAGNLTPAECMAAGGQWGGWQSTCAAHPCPPPTGGACCRPDGGCQAVPNPQACIDLGGIFFAGGDCGAVQCVGSCCFGGQCFMRSPQQCAAMGGTYVGGLSCNPDPCAVIGACCCVTSHGLSCNLATQAECEAGPCFWRGPGTDCSGPEPCVINPARTVVGFSRGLVLPDGSPADGALVRGCAGCGSAEAGSRF